MFHKKVASEDDREVILLTKKSSRFALKNSLDAILGKNKPVPEDEDPTESEPANVGNKLEKFLTRKIDESTKSAETEPTYSIEFEADNRLKLVPKMNNDGDKKEESKSVPKIFEPGRL